MALNKQQIDYLFSKGIDTKTHPYVVGAGQAVDVRNARLDDDGLVVKRPGFAALGDQNTEAAYVSGKDARQLIEYNDQLLLLDGKDAHVYMEGSDEWKTVGALPLMGVAEEGLLVQDSTITERQAYRSMVYANGYYFLVNDRQYSVVSDDGVVVVAATALPAVSTISGTQRCPPRVVLCGDTACIVYATTVNAELRVLELDTTDPTAAGTGYVLVTDCPTTADDRRFDIIPWTATEFLMFYTKDNTNHYPDIGRVALGGTYTTLDNSLIPTLLAPPNASPISLCKTSATNFVLFATYIDSGNMVYTQPFTYTAGSDSFATNGRINVDNVNALNAITSMVSHEAEDSTANVSIFYEEANGASVVNNTRIRWVTTSVSAVVTAAAYFNRGVGIATRPWKQDGRLFIGGAYVSNGLPVEGLEVVPQTNTGYIFNAEAKVVGRFLVDTLGTWFSTSAGEMGVIANEGMVWCDVADLGNNKFAFVRGAKGPIVDADGGVAGGVTRLAQNVTLVSVDFSSGGSYTQHNGVLNISSGILWCWDGRSLMENNVLWSIQPLTASQVGTGGALDLTSKYSYLAVYRWIDAAGNSHTSAASHVISVTLTGGGNEIEVVVPTLRLSGMDKTSLDSVIIQLYRTEGDGSIYYAEQGKANDHTVDSLTFSSDLADSVISDEEQIYITGGVLDNNAPPSGGHVTDLGNRLALIGPDYNLWYSKLVQEEQVVGWSSALRLPLPQSNGRPVACHKLGASNIIFMESGVYRFYGEGPNDVGYGAGYSALEPLSSNIGMVAGTPLLRVDDGVIFQSKKGLWLLTEGLKFSYVGAAVEQYTEGLTLRHALRADDENQAQFCFAGQSYVLSLDTLSGRWSRHLPGIDEVRAIGRWNDAWLWAINDGGDAGTFTALWKEDTSYTDGASAAIQMLVETPWIRMDKFNGFQRCWWVHFLGRWKSAHTLNIDVWYDYATSVSQHVTFDLSSGFSVDDPIRLRVKPTVQKFEAVKFRVYDSLQAGTEQSLDMIVLSLIAGIKRKRGLSSTYSK